MGGGQGEKLKEGGEERKLGRVLLNCVGGCTAMPDLHHCSVNCGHIHYTSHVDGHFLTCRRPMASSQPVEFLRPVTCS